MTYPPESEDLTQAGAAIAERRRASLPECPDTRLIRLLKERRQARAVRDPASDDDPMAPARGVGVGVLLGVAIWTALSLLFWLLTRY
jgi:hypothetical protein